MIININYRNKLLQYVEQRLIPNTDSKEQTGEVFTPLSIIKDMLNKLPENVWSNPKLKWLDPCVGIGNFMILVYFRLMEGLKTWEKNEEKRRRHILENMLFMVEINETSIEILSSIFCGDLYTLNIHSGSFLDECFIGKYNIILGNPPYNEGGIGRASGSRMPFWPKFVNKSLQLLNNDMESYLLMIHPTGWRKPYTTVERDPITNRKNQPNIGRIFHKFIKEGSIYYLKMSDQKIPNFPPVDRYIYTNHKRVKTVVDCIFQKVQSYGNKVDLSLFIRDEFGYLPSFINNTVMNIFRKLFQKYNTNENYTVRYDGYFPVNKKMIEYEEGVAPRAFYFREGKYLEVYKKDEKNHEKKYFHQPKIIMTFSGSNPIGKLNPIYYEKDIGVSSHTMYYLIKEKKDIQKHLNFFNSEIIYFLMKLTQYSPMPRNRNDYKILNRIQIPNLCEEPTNDDIYEYYHILEKERKLILNIIS